MILNAIPDDYWSEEDRAEIREALEAARKLYGCELPIRQTVPTRCAWCKTWLTHIRPTPGQPVSHGICRTCAKTWVEQVPQTLTPELA